MKPEFHFTFASIEQQLLTALEQGYKFITCEEYYFYKKKVRSLKNAW